MKKKLSLEKQAENAFDDMRDKVSDIIEKCELDMTELIDNYNTKYEDVDEFIDAVHKLKNQPELRKELGQNGMKYVHENLTFHKVGNVLSRCIEGCKK